MSSDNQPAFRVYSVIPREGKDDYWLNKVRLIETQAPPGAGLHFFRVVDWRLDHQASVTQTGVSCYDDRHHLHAPRRSFFQRKDDDKRAVVGKSSQLDHHGNLQ